MLIGQNPILMKKTIRKLYNKITGSIAFVPGLMAFCFLILAWLMLKFDFSSVGMQIKSNYSLVKLRDASTARSIVSNITTGIISLVVFSFSMVMIVLNQAASQLSNRTLGNMIANRFQQLVLGCYIGTIVYSLFLSTAIRELDQGVRVPSLSIYLLVLFTAMDIFLFVYFIHYVTQTVKFETIIKRVHDQIVEALRHHNLLSFVGDDFRPDGQAQFILMPATGTLQEADKNALEAKASKLNIKLWFLKPFGHYVLQGVPIIAVYGDGLLQGEQIDDLLRCVDIYPGEPSDKNAYYGTHQLAEIALKALSPGINDPQTAVISLNAIANILNLLLLGNGVYQPLAHQNERVSFKYRTFDDIFNATVLPIWDYGKNDRYINQSLKDLLAQLIQQHPHHQALKTLTDFELRLSC